MPPLALTQSKYALAPLVMSVKSVPGCLVTIAPIGIGVPVAFCALPRPHFEAEAELAAGLPAAAAVPPPPPELSLLLPQAATPTASRAAVTPTASRALMRISLLQMFVLRCP